MRDFTLIHSDIHSLRKGRPRPLRGGQVAPLEVLSRGSVKWSRRPVAGLAVLLPILREIPGEEECLRVGLTGPRTALA